MQESGEDAPALLPRGQEGGALSVREAALGTGRNVRVSGAGGGRGCSLNGTPRRVTARHGKQTAEGVCEAGGRRRGPGGRQCTPALCPVILLPSGF